MKIVEYQDLSEDRRVSGSQWRSSSSRVSVKIVVLSISSSWSLNRPISLYNLYSFQSLLFVHIISTNLSCKYIKSEYCISLFYFAKVYGFIQQYIPKEACTLNKNIKTNIAISLFISLDLHLYLFNMVTAQFNVLL